MTKSPSKLVAADAFYHCSGAQIQGIGEWRNGTCFFNNPGNNERKMFGLCLLDLDDVI